MSMMIVCPYCGPQSLAYAGRIVLIACATCKARIHHAETVGDHESGTIQANSLRASQEEG